MKPAHFVGEAYEQFVEWADDSLIFSIELTNSSKTLAAHLSKA